MMSHGVLIEVLTGPAAAWLSYDSLAIEFCPQGTKMINIRCGRHR